jgi:hypothetical protein
MLRLAETGVPTRMPRWKTSPIKARESTSFEKQREGTQEPTPPSMTKREIARTIKKVLDE